MVASKVRLAKACRYVPAVALAWISLVVASSSSLAQVNWNNSVGGVFSTGSNWAGGVTPNSTQVANFVGSGANLGVTFTAPAVTRGLTIRSGVYTFNLGGNTFSLIDNNSFAKPFEMGLASGETSSLTLFDGTLSTSIGAIGSASGSTASLTLGTGSRLAASQFVNVGLDGTGTLSINNGAVFDADRLLLGNSATGNGTLNISGPNAAANFASGIFGLAGQSQVNIENGGTLNTTDFIVLASSAGSFSNVQIEGADSTWNLNGGGILAGSGGTSISLSGRINAVDASIQLTQSSLLDIFGGGHLSLTGHSIFGLQSQGNIVVNGGSVMDIASDAGMIIGNTGLLEMRGGTVSTRSLALNGTLDFQRGLLTVDGGTFTRNGSFGLSGSTGDSTFTLANGATTNSLTSLTVGNFNTSSLREFQVLSGSTLNTSALSTIGQLGSNSTLRVSGSGSTWNANNIISVGDSGEGKLVIENGGRLITNGNSLLTGVAGAGGNGSLTVQSGGSVDAGLIELARVAGSVSNASIVGSGTQVNTTGLFVGGSSTGEGGSATLTIDDGADVNVAGTLRARNAGTINVNGGHVTTQNLTRNATGALNFRDGTLTVLGLYSNTSGNLTLAGTDLNDNPHLVLAGAALTSGITNLNVGSSNRQGTLSVQSNAQLTTGALAIGNMGTVNLNGGRMLIGSLASTGDFNWTEGTVDFSAGNTLNSASLTSLLGTSHSLAEGRTLGSISGTMTLDSFVNVNGGTLSPSNLINNSSLTVHEGQVATSTLTNNAGRTILINGNSNVAGNSAINNSGTIRMNSLAASISGGELTNNANGTISGTGQINNDLTNLGTVRVSSSEHLVLNGANNLNVMNVNLSGGTLEVSQALTNRSGAAITGRGTLITSSSSPGGNGLTNDGLMSFSAGITDVHGDVNQTSDGRIVTSGSGVTTFFDDVIHNGTEIRTFLGSTTVFLGEQTGAGNFTGTGVVEYAGDLRPGNSPASISYEGDVMFNSSVRSFIEIGGTSSGDFDQLLIDGDFHVDGSLFISLINGHSLSAGDFYLIGDVGGLLTGQFNGLGEGSLVGNFGGQDLFITYSGGDIGLFTAVPEPSSLLLITLASVGLIGVRRRKPVKGTRNSSSEAQSIETNFVQSDGRAPAASLRRCLSVVWAGLIFSGCGVGVHPTLQAELITIQNAGFETTVLNNGVSTNSVTSWSQLGPISVLNPDATQFLNGGASQGDNVAIMGASGSILHQNLGINLALGTYTFQFDVGNRLDAALPDVGFNFLINATTIMPLSASSRPAVAEGEFETWTFTYNVTPTLNNFIGSPTRIRFLVLDTSTGGSVAIDNVRGTFTAVPEPNSWVLCSATALVASRLRRRRRMMSRC